MSGRWSDEYTRERAADLLGIASLPFLLPAEAASRLGLTEGQITKMARNREIYHLRVGKGCFRFDPIEVALFQDPDALSNADFARTRGEVAERLSNASTVVYFIQMEVSRHVKIGVATTFRKRLAGLQNGNPERLTPLCVIQGDFAIEAALHEAFKPWRLRGEWFEWSPVLGDAVEKLNAGSHVVDVLRDVCLYGEKLQ